MKKSLYKMTVGAALTFAVLAGGAIPAQASSIHTPSQVSTQQNIKQVQNVSQLLSKASSKTRYAKKATIIRTSSSRKAKRVATMRKGMKATVLQTKGSWTRVKAGKSTGWVASRDLSTKKTTSSSSKKTSTASAKKTITRYATTGVNIRSNAGTKYKRIGSLKKGAKVTVTRSKSGWSQIKSGKTTGWVSSKYLSSKKPSTAKKTTTASKKTTLTRYATTNVNIRSNAGTKYKKIGTLKKGAKVTVTRSKSGWSQIKSGKTTGWVSSKYLNSKKPAAPKKAAKKKAAKKITLSQIKTYSQAQQYLKQTCPKVKITKIKGTHSMYNPNTQTIMIASAHQNSSRLGWVFAHELMHHYQWHGKYKNNVSAWNKGIKGKKPVEIEADKMTYHMYGSKNKLGHYSKTPATGKQLANLKSLINKGKKAGC